MPLCSFDTTKAKLKGVGPYTARSASDRTDDWPYWYVTNDGRTNVLSFAGGAVLTSKRVAIKIAAMANGEFE